MDMREEVWANDDGSVRYVSDIAFPECSLALSDVAAADSSWVSAQAFDLSKWGKRNLSTILRH